MNQGLDLIEYIKRSPSPYHVVEEGKNILTRAGFHELTLTEAWNLDYGGAYVVPCFGTSLLAFTIGENVQRNQMFRIAAAHTDHPCLHVKPVAELTQKDYLRVNCEIYGGPILNTWMDRPLSIAGCVTLRSDRVMEPKKQLLNVERPFLTIPNLAIHMNKEVNKGIELMKQTDMLPLMGILNDKLNEKNFFLDFIAKQLGVELSDILDFDLYVYNTENGLFLGVQEELIQSPRLDNLTSCYALVKGIAGGKRSQGINVIALFDHEEIGSETKQGANSALLEMCLEKIYHALSFEHTELNESILKSFLLSVDVAHAMHPARTEKSDPMNYALMNDGVVFKISGNQRYTFDTKAIGALQQLCEKYHIKYKKYVNHSDIAGGSTLGPMISARLPMQTVDLGVPLLAMHSSNELMGRQDQEELEKLIKVFFEEE